MVPAAEAAAILPEANTNEGRTGDFTKMRRPCLMELTKKEGHSVRMRMKNQWKLSWEL